MPKCKNCGTPFEERRGSGRKREFCCQKCGDQFRYKQKRLNKTIKKNCEWCGATFFAMHERIRFCSNSCSGKYRMMNKRKYPVIKKCVVCGKDFEALNKRVKCCSQECGHVLSGRIGSKSAEATIKWLTCVNCGAQFRKTRRGQKFCSHSCYLEYMLQVDASSAAHFQLGANGKKHVRRAKKYGVKYERINPVDIYERDNWVCQICGEPVDKYLRWPHPLSASLDHIVPLSKGGQHVESNVQLAHYRCNTLKGASAENAEAFFV